MESPLLCEKISAAPLFHGLGTKEPFTRLAIKMLHIIVRSLFSFCGWIDVQRNLNKQHSICGQVACGLLLLLPRRRESPGIRPQATSHRPQEQEISVKLEHPVFCNCGESSFSFVWLFFGILFHIDCEWILGKTKEIYHLVHPSHPSSRSRGPQRINNMHINQRVEGAKA